MFDFVRLDWIDQKSERQIMIVFRTFGSEVIEMLRMIDARGYGDAILKDSNGQPLVTFK